MTNWCSIWHYKIRLVLVIVQNFMNCSLSLQ